MTLMSLPLSPFPSHLKTAEPCLQYPALHKNKGRKEESNGITCSISCEVHIVANDGDKRSGFTTQKAQTSV